jgi:hypothetical protein
VTKRRVALAAAAVAAAATVAGTAWYRSRALATTAGAVARLPTGDATVLHIDVAALRDSGLLARLAGSTVAEEPEYRAFVERTGFDYRRDLDAATLAFSPGQIYLLLRGRFETNTLRRYAEGQGGVCDGQGCRMQGSRPERQISFLPLRDNVFAMSVGLRGGAAADLRRKPTSARPIAVPPDPLWVSLSPAALRDYEKLPPGTRAIARAMENASAALLSLAPAGGAFELRLTLECRSEGAARTLAGHLRETTEMLRKMIAREGQAPNPADLSGVLTAGEFRQDGRRVLGRWPIARGFLDSLLGGAD